MSKMREAFEKWWKAHAFKAEHEGRMHVALDRRVSHLCENPWLEAAVAWEVCASIHERYAKGKDALYSTRRRDFLKHAEDARKMANIEHNRRPVGRPVDCVVRFLCHK